MTVQNEKRRQEGIQAILIHLKQNGSYIWPLIVTFWVDELAGFVLNYNCLLLWPSFIRMIINLETSHTFSAL